MPLSRKPLVSLAIAALGISLVAGCSEQLENGAACPALCPEQNVPVRDTVLFAAVSLDTTIAGLPSLGAETRLLLAADGDALDTRVVARFETLPTRIGVTATDTGRLVTAVDSAYVQVRIDSTGLRLPAGPLTIEAYDVDTTASDTALGAVAALFRPDRQIGTGTFDSAAVKDSIRVPLDNDALLARITSGRRVRVGLRVRADGPAQVRIFSTEGGVAPRLSYDPAPDDTAVKPVSLPTRSVTPEGQAAIAGELADYTLVVAGTASGAADGLLVGGLPSRRTYLRFDIPPALLDSATIVRATLLLTQRPTPTLGASGKLVLVPRAVIAGAAVTDPARAAAILAPVGVGALDSLTLSPGESGERAIELGASNNGNSLIGRWRLQTNDAPHAVVLQASGEGATPLLVNFFSSEAGVDSTMRPRVRISFIPRVEFGLP